MFHHKISKDLGMSWAGWQEGHLDDVLLFHNFNSKKSCDHVKRLTLAANHLKNLAGNTQNRNKSKINLDS